MQRQILARSLEKLLREEPITEITVKEITGNCGLSTRTFYNYFSDKFDLMCFYYYTRNESCWFENDHPRSLTAYCNKWLSGGSPDNKVMRNMYAYVGQNDIREFAVCKTFNDLYRYFLWASKPDVIDDPAGFNVIVYLAYSFTGTMECATKAGKVYSPDLALRGINEKYRKILLADPNPASSVIPVKGFHVSEIEWPPKFYDLHPA